MSGDEHRKQQDVVSTGQEDQPTTRSKRRISATLRELFEKKPELKLLFSTAYDALTSEWQSILVTLRDTHKPLKILYAIGKFNQALRDFLELQEPADIEDDESLLNAESKKGLFDYFGQRNYITLQRPQLEEIISIYLGHQDYSAHCLKEKQRKKSNSSYRFHDKILTGNDHEQIRLCYQTSLTLLARIIESAIKVEDSQLTAQEICDAFLMQDLPINFEVIHDYFNHLTCYIPDYNILLEKQLMRILANLSLAKLYLLDKHSQVMLKSLITKIEALLSKDTRTSIQLQSILTFMEENHLANEDERYEHATIFEFLEYFSNNLLSPQTLACHSSHPDVTSYYQAAFYHEGIQKAWEKVLTSFVLVDDLNFEIYCAFEQLSNELKQLPYMTDELEINIITYLFKHSKARIAPEHINQLKAIRKILFENEDSFHIANLISVIIPGDLNSSPLHLETDPSWEADEPNNFHLLTSIKNGTSPFQNEDKFIAWAIKLIREICHYYVFYEHDNLFHNQHHVAEEILKEIESLIYNKNKAVIDKYLHILRFIKRKECGKGYLHDILENNLKIVKPLHALCSYHKQTRNNLALYQLLKNNQKLSKKSDEEKSAAISKTPLDIIKAFRDDYRQNKSWINDTFCFQFMKWFFDLFTITNNVAKRIEESGRFQRTSFFTVPKDKPHKSQHFGKRLLINSENTELSLNIRTPSCAA